jgi:hypothetical protein
LKKGNEGEWKYNGRGSMFKVNYTCKELSQWEHLIIIIC